MLFQVNEFCDRVVNELNELLDSLTSETGRSSPEERKAWRNSLVPLSQVLLSASRHSSNLNNADIYLGNIAVEYRLPAASSWCDAILLGQNINYEKQAVIIELKHWQTEQDKKGPEEGLIYHKGQITLHPAEQVRGYTMYCRRFHSIVLEKNAKVDGCVYFTRRTPLDEYFSPPNDRLCNMFPIFNNEITNGGIGKYIGNHIVKENHTFAEEFVKGVYKQDRNILEQVAVSLKKSEDRPFQLLDRQLEGFHLVKHKLKHINKEKGKHVIVVKGPPGSGKSALAVNLWIEAALNHNDKGNIVFVTTSSSQHKNWKHVFDKAGGKHIGGGMVLKANDFKPGLTAKIRKRFINQGYEMSANTWRENMNIFEKNNSEKSFLQSEHFISIVDEAHALINPFDHKMGFSRGWNQWDGPQVFHIIKNSQVSVFLMDSDQSFRDTETTSINDIQKFAWEFNASFETIDLGDAQFRCAGSKEYVDWVESFLELRPRENILPWLKKSSLGHGFQFEVVETPFELDNKLRNLNDKGELCRLVSSYAVPWKTKKETHPHDLKDEKLDFKLEVPDGKGGESIWSRPWNFAPKSDYTMFIQGTKHSMIANDPVAEVGCPYVVRGFDFDYLGVLWLEDLVWRQDRWIFQLDHVYETALPITIADTKKNINDGPERLLDKIKKGYRILLTRALKGIFVYVHDRETKDHLLNSLKKC